MIRKLRLLVGKSLSACGAIHATRYFSISNSMKRGLDWEALEIHSGEEETSVDHIFYSTKINRRVAKRYIYKVKDVFVFPDSGVAFCGAGVVSESSSWPPAETALANPWIKFEKQNSALRGDFVVLPSSAYYHWLIEDLPSFISIISKYPTVTPAVWSKAPKYVNSLLDALGLKASRISAIQRVESLHFVDKTSILGTPQKTDLDLLKGLQTRLGLTAPQGPRVKIYVSRRQAKRSPPGEKELEKALASRGIRVISLEALDWVDQVELFSRADLVIGIHGAGLANTVFCRSGTRVVELLDENYPNNCFEILAEKCDLTFTRVLFSRTLTPDTLSDVLAEI